ncbi:hypothetical protein TNCV_4458981 [Trichonephila clavipes]|nr:hypothetical protein TNCV_4458981 [Trichonephila clavipes]
MEQFFEYRYCKGWMESQCYKKQAFVSELFLFGINRSVRAFALSKDAEQYLVDFAALLMSVQSETGLRTSKNFQPPEHYLYIRSAPVK